MTTNPPNPEPSPNGGESPVIPSSPTGGTPITQPPKAGSTTPKKGWLTPLKVTIGCGILLFGCMVMCCGGIGIIGLFQKDNTDHTAQPIDANTSHRTDDADGKSNDIKSTEPDRSEDQKSLRNLGVTIEGFDAIEEGMTEKEVETIMGKHGKVIIDDGTDKSVAYEKGLGIIGRIKSIIVRYCNGVVHSKNKDF